MPVLLPPKAIAGRIKQQTHLELFGKNPPSQVGKEMDTLGFTSGKTRTKYGIVRIVKVSQLAEMVDRYLLIPLNDKHMDNSLDQNQTIELIIPLHMLLWEVDSELALQESLDNRKETPQFERRLIQAERDLTQAKRNAGLNATLQMSYGVSNSADSFGGIYENPEQQQNVRLALSVPILDWGRSESQVKLAESRRELVLYDVDQDRQDFERRVVVMVEQFNLIKSQIATAEAADKVAGEGYKIALKKFQNGEISITDLNISLAEREGAKRDYISSIENYWESYYLLREVTLYDFEFHQKIYYTNPMLNAE